MLLEPFMERYRTKARIEMFARALGRYSYLVNLPDKANVGEAINDAMELIKGQSKQIIDILRKTYTAFQNDLLRIFAKPATNFSPN